jgi:16S rRNA processing protein RimM
MTCSRIVGKISGFHGIKGEVKIYPLLDDIEAFRNFDTLIINDQELRPVSVRFHKSWVIIQFKDYEDINSVQNFSGYVYTYLDEKLEDKQFYIEDLKGLKVIDSQGLDFGTVQDFDSEGQPKILIKLVPNYYAKRDLILPFVEEYVLEVNLEKSFIKVSVPDDLLDLTRI